MGCSPFSGNIFSCWFKDVVDGWSAGEVAVGRTLKLSTLVNDNDNLLSGVDEPMIFRWSLPVTSSDITFCVGELLNGWLSITLGNKTSGAWPNGEGFCCKR